MTSDLDLSSLRGALVDWKKRVLARHDSDEYRKPTKTQEEPTKIASSPLKRHQFAFSHQQQLRDGRVGGYTQSRANKRRRFFLFSIHRSTEDHFRWATEDAPQSVGAYGHFRALQDCNYHAHYRKERQWFHDAIIGDYLFESQTRSTPENSIHNSSGSILPGGSSQSLPLETVASSIQTSSMLVAPTRQWLIIMVGAQGSGKQHTIRHLIALDRLPLLSFVSIDQDQIRRLLPEYSSYLEECSSAQVTALTQKECGYIAETLTLAVLQAGRNAILDGCCLRDYQWYIKYLKGLRQQHPLLQVALIHVETDGVRTLVCRSRKKSIETGREIAKSELVRALEQLARSLHMVKPHVDFFCTIRNDDQCSLRLVPDNSHITKEVTINNRDHNKSDDHLQQRSILDWDTFRRAFDQRIMEGDNIVTPMPMESLTLPEQVNMAERRASQQLRRSSRIRRFSCMRSSEDNNRSDDWNFYGSYAHIRKTMDYSYHKNYTRERQFFQDAIINEFLNAAVITDKNGEVCTTPTEPWIVFTAGAMGAGKSYAMRQLVENGRFPLMAFVRVDPDEIRRFLPEFHLYVSENPELAGELTRKESGYVAEILTLAGLHAGKNVLVDGSLRDADWYRHYFIRLRNQFVSLRLAIIHVTAPREAVFQRAAERALATGRIVPAELLARAYEQVPISVAELTPQVDYVVEILNEPKANDIQLVTPGETWETFQRQWIQTCAWVPSRDKMITKSRELEKKLSIAVEN